MPAHVHQGSLVASNLAVFGSRGLDGDVGLQMGFPPIPVVHSQLAAALVAHDEGS